MLECDVQIRDNFRLFYFGCNIFAIFVKYSFYLQTPTFRFFSRTTRGLDIKKTVHTKITPQIKTSMYM